MILTLWVFGWNVSIKIGWITMKSGSHIHVPLRKNCNKCSDPFTFCQVPSSGENWICPILWFINKYLAIDSKFCYSLLNETVKGLFHSNDRETTCSHISLVLSSCEDSCGFICPGFEMYISDVCIYSYTMKVTLFGNSHLFFVFKLKNYILKKLWATQTKFVLPP